MEKTKRNPALIIIGVIMIISGVITFIVSAVQLYNVQRRKNSLGRGIYAGLSGKNKCNKFHTMLHIYGTCSVNYHCRHSYAMHKTKNTVCDSSEYACWI